MKQRNLLLSGVVIILIIAGIYWFSDKSSDPSDKSSNAFGFLNTSYVIENRPVTLVNGKAEEVISDSASKITTEVFGEPANGDLDGDGKSDSAVILVQNTGGSGTFYYVAAALDTDAGVKGTAAVLLGDRIAPQTLEARDGAIIVNYAVRKPNEAMTVSPSVGVTKYLIVDGETIRELLIKKETLEVASPAPLQKISSPVSVTGKSNFFEANTRIRIKDIAGNVLADTFTTAEGWTKLYPFSKEVTYAKPSVNYGLVEVFGESAKDGSEQNKITIPVVFAD